MMMGESKLFSLEDKHRAGIRLQQFGIEAAFLEECSGEGLAIAPPATIVYILLGNLVIIGWIQPL